MKDFRTQQDIVVRPQTQEGGGSQKHQSPEPLLTCSSAHDFYKETLISVHIAEKTETIRMKDRRNVTDLYCPGS